jgi:hypothetical protein
MRLGVTPGVLIWIPEGSLGRTGVLAIGVEKVLVLGWRGSRDGVEGRTPPTLRIGRGAEKAAETDLAGVPPVRGGRKEEEG